MQHEKVVRYYGTVVEGLDRMYLVMEMVEGPTLKEVVDATIERKEQLPSERIWDIFIQLCTALRCVRLAVMPVCAANRGCRVNAGARTILGRARNLLAETQHS